MSERPWLHHGNSLTRVVVHMVWATRDRSPMLPPQTDPRLARLIGDRCAELGCRAIAVGNASDHAHVLVLLSPLVTLSTLAQRLEGATSRLLGMQLAGGLLWQASYFAESVGELAAVTAYVRNQRARHAHGAPAEGWEALFSRHG